MLYAATDPPLFGQVKTTPNDWPTVAVAGLSEGTGTTVVAPTREFMAPRDAAAAIEERRTAPTGEDATISSATSTMCRAGVRCRRASRVAPGKLSQR